jgi:hypothetical protein
MLISFFQVDVLVRHLHKFLANVRSVQRVFGLEKKQLRDYQRRHIVLDRARDEDDPLLEQARIDVIGALAPVGLFDHHGDELYPQSQ